MWGYAWWAGAGVVGGWAELAGWMLSRSSFAGASTAAPGGCTWSGGLLGAQCPFAPLLRVTHRSAGSSAQLNTLPLRLQPSSIRESIGGRHLQPASWRKWDVAKRLHFFWVRCWCQAVATVWWAAKLNQCAYSFVAAAAACPLPGPELCARDSGQQSYQLRRQYCPLPPAPPQVAPHSRPAAMSAAPARPFEDVSAGDAWGRNAARERRHTAEATSLARGPPMLSRIEDGCSRGKATCF